MHRKSDFDGEIQRAFRAAGLDVMQTFPIDTGYSPRDLKYLMDTFEGDSGYSRELSDLRSLTNHLSPVKENETAAISFSPKTAALCFDRVWFAGRIGDIPSEIQFFGASNEELLFAMLVSWTQFAISSGNEKYLKAAGNMWHAFGSNEQEPEAGLQIVATAARRNFHVPVTPIYRQDALMRGVYRQGDYSVIVAVLENLEIVKEEEITWTQVQEFRNDIDSRRKYQRLVHWLDSAMVGRDQSFIKDAIEIKLADYRFALRKHGIKTILGSISALSDPKGILAGAAALATGIAAHQALAGLLAAAGVIATRVVVEIGYACLDLAEVRRGPNSEIAFVHEANKLKKPGLL